MSLRKTDAWADNEIAKAEKEAAEKAKRDKENRVAVKKAWVTLALVFTEDNYRKALEACEAWKPTPKFPKNYEYDRTARQARGQDEVLKNLSDTPKSCAELYELVKHEASCPDAVRKMVNTLIRNGEAVKVKCGNSVFYRRSGEK